MKSEKRLPKLKKKHNFKLGEVVRLYHINWSNGDHIIAYGEVIKIYLNNIKIIIGGKNTKIISRYSPYLEKLW